MRPYLGIGVAHIESEETGWEGQKISTKGTGTELLGGVKFNLKTIPQLYLTAEFIFSPIKIKGTYEYWRGYVQTVETTWNSFSLAFTVIYYF